MTKTKKPKSVKPRHYAEVAPGTPTLVRSPDGRAWRLDRKGVAYHEDVDSRLHAARPARLPPEVAATDRILALNREIRRDQPLRMPRGAVLARRWDARDTWIEIYYCGSDPADLIVRAGGWDTHRSRRLSPAATAALLADLQIAPSPVELPVVAVRRAGEGSPSCGPLPSARPEPRGEVSAVRTVTITIDWPRLHEAMSVLDVARAVGGRTNRWLGKRDCYDALGGSYSGANYERRGLAGAVALAGALKSITEHAWETCHAAHGLHDLDGARAAVRVMLAARPVYDLLSSVGVLDASLGAICAGYRDDGEINLTGLRWLAGDVEEQGRVSVEDARAFAAGGPASAMALPTV